MMSRKIGGEIATVLVGGALIANSAIYSHKEESPTPKQIKATETSVGIRLASTAAQIGEKALARVNTFKRHDRNQFAPITQERGDEYTIILQTAGFSSDYARLDGSSFESAFLTTVVMGETNNKPDPAKTTNVTIKGGNSLAASGSGFDTGEGNLDIYYSAYHDRWSGNGIVRYPNSVHTNKIDANTSDELMHAVHEADRLTAATQSLANVALSLPIDEFQAP